MCAKWEQGNDSDEDIGHLRYSVAQDIKRVFHGAENVSIIRSEIAKEAIAKINELYDLCEIEQAYTHCKEYGERVLPLPTLQRMMRKEITENLYTIFDPDRGLLLIDKELPRSYFNDTLACRVPIYGKGMHPNGIHFFYAGIKILRDLGALPKFKRQTE
jgi:hypothetical protein